MAKSGWKNTCYIISRVFWWFGLDTTAESSAMVTFFPIYWRFPAVVHPSAGKNSVNRSFDDFKRWLLSPVLSEARQCESQASEVESKQHN